MARNQSEVQTSPEAPELKCPHCGEASPENLSYYEVRRANYAIAQFGTALVLDKGEPIRDPEDPEDIVESWGIECGRCSREFSIPVGFTLSY